MSRANRPLRVLLLGGCNTECIKNISELVCLYTSILILPSFYINTFFKLNRNLNRGMHAKVLYLFLYSSSRTKALALAFWLYPYDVVKRNC